MWVSACVSPSSRDGPAADVSLLFSYVGMQTFYALLSPHSKQCKVSVLAKTIYKFSPCLHRNVTSSICSAEFKNINTCLRKEKTCLSASLLQPRGIILIELAKRPNRANSLSSTSFSMNGGTIFVAGAESAVSCRNCSFTTTPLSIRRLTKTYFLRKTTTALFILDAEKTCSFPTSFPHGQQHVLYRRISVRDAPKP